MYLVIINGVERYIESESEEQITIDFSAAVAALPDEESKGSKLFRIDEEQATIHFVADRESKKVVDLVNIFKECTRCVNAVFGKMEEKDEN